MTNYQDLLAELEQELEGIQYERARIERKEAALKTSIEGLKQLIEISSPSQPPSTDVPLIPAYLFKDSSIIEAGVRYLQLVGKPQKTRPMVDSIVSHGLKSNADDPYITFRSVWMRAMKKHGTFTYNEKKEWGLPEWNMKD